MWNLTVCSLMWSSRAICLLESPRASSPRTSPSRAVGGSESSSAADTPASAPSAMALGSTTSPCATAATAAPRSSGGASGGTTPQPPSRRGRRPRRPPPREPPRHRCDRCPELRGRRVRRHDAPAPKRQRPQPGSRPFLLREQHQALGAVLGDGERRLLEQLLVCHEHDL